MLNLALSDPVHNLAYKNRAYHSLLTLQSTYKQLDSLKQKSDTNADSLFQSLENYYKAVDRNIELTDKKYDSLIRVKGLEDSLSFIQAQRDKIQTFNSHIESSIRQLTDALERILDRNNVLFNIKEDLKNKLVESLPKFSIIEFDSMWQRLDYSAKLDSLDAALLAARGAEARLGHLEEERSKRLARIEVLGETNFIRLDSSFSIISENDILALTQTKIEITKYFNERLARYIDLLKTTITDIEKRIKKQENETSLLKTDIDSLTIHRTRLHSAISDTLEKFTREKQQYNSNIIIFKERAQLYNDEYVKQLQLFEDIGVLRLLIERAKSYTSVQ
ncbi:hypothetical protein EH223_10825 [candidate division KSB1 bacterium]|nr:hypothetical protein [candidate division KSB1 bacterium]RQW03114.1 MAG: hypothetical protein EH223_10825 [candidate division KSB1 bacterium]